MSSTWPAGLRPAGTAKAAKIRSSARCRHYRPSKSRALRTTHQPSSPQWGEVYLRLLRVVPRPGAITGGYSRKYFHQTEREKEEKMPATYTEHLKTENVNLGGERPAAEVGFPVWISRCLQTVNGCLFPGLIPGQGSRFGFPSAKVINIESIETSGHGYHSGG